MQPLLPVRETPKTLEYTPGDDDSPPWLIEDWRAIAAAFDLLDHEVVAWHLALAGQGRPWLVIKRMFRVAPLFGPGADDADLQAWSWAQLSASLSVPESHLKTDLEAAQEFWKKHRLSQAIQRQVSADSSNSPSKIQNPKSIAPGDGVNPLDGLPQFQIHQAFTDDQITAVLTPFRFNSVRSSADRLYVANRILELRKLLEDKLTRESARTLIVMELNMASHENTLHVFKSRMETLQRGSEITKEQSAEVLKISESITSTEKALTLLSTTYRTAAADLGGDEMEAGEMRRVAIGTISHLTEAHRQYYADGSKSPIDGMFTAEEVVWLTTPLTIRPAQYRPDVVLRMREACIPENLWGKDYQPSVIQRDACRRLAKLVQLLAEESEPAVIAGIDDAKSSINDEMDDSAMFQDPVAMVQATTSSDYTAPPTRPDEPCLAIG